MSNLKQIALEMNEKEPIVVADERDAHKLAANIRLLRQPSGNCYVGTVKKSEKEAK